MQSAGQLLCHADLRKPVTRRDPTTASPPKWRTNTRHERTALRVRSVNALARGGGAAAGAGGRGQGL